MGDVDHQWGSDLSFGPTGDVAVVSGAAMGQERVLRRLLTNPLDYIWQPTYGAGLAAFVGSPTNSTRIQSVIRSQIFKETTVARDPEPTINISINPGGSTGDVYVQVFYVDAPTGQTQVMTFSVGS
ncbi:MAG TPA: hypothetical protein VMB73_27185 [Acetobacteraceae bacterium]|jgi:hypothetical protein|nr:hypothetical protein [Acetobacteraceae bacterium]